VTQRIGDIEVSTRRLRIFLANLAIALGWALKGSCKACAYRLFATARWLVPEAERFLVLRAASHNHYRRIFKFAVDLDTLLTHIQPLRVAAGALVVLVLLGSLDLVTRATAITTQLLVGDSAFQLESQLVSGVSVSKLSEPTREPAPVSKMQSEAIPLPTRKPQGAYRVSNETGAIPVTQKKVARPKSARYKPRR
jgi:hypothetical protein